MLKLVRILGLASIIAGVTFLSGCAAVNTSVAKRNLDVQTKVSTAIFVDPVKKKYSTVYVDVRSSVMEFDRKAFWKSMRKSFAENENGYRITDDPDAAQYHLSVYVRTLEKASPTAAEVALKQGYQDDRAAGAAAGGVVGADQTGSWTGATGGSVLGALATTAANAFVQDVTYMLIADVQIKEKTRKGVFVRKDSQISTKISDAGSSTQRVSEVSKHKEYRTRVVTTANQVNLELAEAQESMFKKTAYAISGFF